MSNSTVAYNGPFPLHNQRLVDSGSVFQGWVTYVYSPSKFYVQYESDQSARFLDMQNALQKECEKWTEPPRNLSIREGRAYAAKRNGQWCRVILESVRSTEGVVFFVDTGYNQSVKLTELLPLSSKYMELPVQAFRCHLSSLKSRNASWSRASCDFFQDLVTNSYVNVFVEASVCGNTGRFSTKGYRLYVVIYIGTDDISVNTRLTQAGYSYSVTNHERHWHSKLKKAKTVSGNQCLDSSAWDLSSLKQHESSKEKSNLDLTEYTADHKGDSNIKQDIERDKYKEVEWEDLSECDSFFKHCTKAVTGELSESVVMGIAEEVRKYEKLGSFETPPSTALATPKCDREISQASLSFFAPLISKIEEDKSQPAHKSDSLVNSLKSLSEVGDAIDKLATEVNLLELTGIGDWTEWKTYGSMPVDGDYMVSGTFLACESPDAIYVRPTVYESLFHRLSADLQRTYRSQKTEKISNISIGIRCAVYVYGRWIRAILTEFDENLRCLVRDMDSGQPHNVALDRIYTLAQPFEAIPKLSIRCSLIALHPIGSAWNDDVNLLINRTLSEADQMFLCCKSRPKAIPNKMAVTIIYQLNEKADSASVMVNLNDLLVERKLAQYQRLL